MKTGKEKTNNGNDIGLYPQLRGNINSIKFPAFAEPKFDGEYNQIIFASRKIYCVNKNKNIKYDFPALDNIFNKIQNKINSCILLCEIFTKEGKLGALYDFLSQKKSNNLNLIIHDIAEINSTNVKPFKTLDRKELLHELLPDDVIESKWIENKNEAMAYFQKLTNEGYEGVVLKNIDSPLIYGLCDWAKIKYKDRNDYDVVFVDSDRERIEICSYGTPGTATHMSGISVGVKALNKYKKYIKKGDIVTIEHSGRLNSGSLRNPILIPKKEWE